MAKKKKGEPESDASFESLIGDVKRIVSDRVKDDTPRPAPIPSQRLKDERLALEESRLPTDPVDEELEAGEALNWCRNGLNHDLKRLKRGDFAVEGSLDLHGMTSTEAKSALVRFLNDALADRCHCVRVIHGKGRGSPGKVPVLKGKVAKWLMARDEILACCSAPVHDGGSGVAWVLLKSR